jgi:radical SAM superfamily enzyme
MNKGVTAREHVEGCLKTKEAGLSCSVYVMPGLGGEEWSVDHAGQTAEVLTQISPDFVRLRTLEIFPMTPLEEARKNGEFREATEEQVVREIRTLVSETQGPTVIVSDSASNLLEVNGRLPEDREDTLRVIDDYLSLPDREKLYFSLTARLRSFVGQYGGLSDDIIRVLAPFAKGSELDVSAASDDRLQSIIRLVRSKLMP